MFSACILLVIYSGGFLAQHFAAKYPTRVRCAVCGFVMDAEGKGEHSTSAGLWCFATPLPLPMLSSREPARASLGTRYPRTSLVSCFMNMIDFYLLKGQSEFLHVKQKQLPCFKVSVCISAHSWSSDSAIQVTCFVR